MNALRVDEVDRVRQVLAHLPAAVLVDDRHFVVAEPVGMVFLEVVRRVVNQELADAGIPVREDLAADVPLVGEVEAAVVVTRRLAIEVIEAAVVEAAPRVVKNNVKEHSDPVNVKDVDQRLQLIDLGVERAGRRGAHRALGGAG